MLNVLAHFMVNESNFVFGHEVVPWEFICTNVNKMWYGLL